MICKYATLYLQSNSLKQLVEGGLRFVWTI